MAIYSANFLGGFRIYSGKSLITSFKSRKERALLALLFLRQGVRLERTAIAGLLWSDSLEKRALKNLRVELSRLRRTLGEAALDKPIIGANNQHIWLENREAIESDIWQFEAAHKVVTTMAPDEKVTDSKANAMVAQAVTLYNGMLLENFESGSAAYDEWIEEFRVRVHQKAVTLVTLAARQAESRGDHEGMLRATQKLIAWNPWDEQATRWEMRAFARQGNFGAALARYEALRDVLDNALDVEPGKPLQAYAQTLRDAASDRSAPVERRRARVAGKLTGQQHAIFRPENVN